ncbi:MAG: extracellular solute-binding protein [Spirochaetes bacterium]|nr:extracellular solute-binding protein [Spirochaetota bacterium]
MIRTKKRSVFIKFIFLVFLFCIFLSVCKKEVKILNKNEEKVELNMWLVGDTVPDYDLMLEELNKIMLEDINATIKVNFTTWIDWRSKLRLALSSGEKIDLIHMAPWSIYDEQAKLGAFMPLEGIAPVYAPKTWESYSENVLNSAKVNGHVFMLPFRYVDPEGNGFLYRLDLAEKYGIGKIKGIDDLERYMKVVKDKEGIIPYNAGGFDNQVMSESFAIWMNFWPDSPDEILVQGQMSYFKVFQNDPEKPFVIFEHKAFKEALKYARRFYLAGYWPENVLANKKDSREAILNGTSAITNLNPINANEEYKRIMAKNPLWKLDWFSPYQKLTHPPKSPANNNGMSIPVSSKNPERALMLLEKLHQDQRYHDLTTYGIRGKHWDLDSNQDIILPEGVSADTTGFPWDRPCPWGWREKELYRVEPTKLKSTWQVIRDWILYVYKNGSEKQFGDFKFDKTAVEAELAAIDSVKTQYVDPLLWGMIADPEKGYLEMMNKMNQAGLQKVKSEFNEQWKQYLKNKKK